MTPRERIVTTLQRQEPDRVPLDFGGTQTGITAQAYMNLKRYLGLGWEGEKIIDMMQQIVQPEEEVLVRLGIDTRYILPGAPKGWKLEVKEEADYYSYVDEWGITLQMPKQKGYYYDMVRHPLQDTQKEALEDYPWPDPHDPGRTEGLAERVKKLYEETPYALVTGIAGSLFELSWYLRGFERFYMDLIENQDFAEAMLDRLLNYWKAFFEDFLGAVGSYIQVVLLGDDLGMQNGLLISPTLYRQIVKPRQQELISFVKKRTNAFILYHTCGSVYQLLPDLIEIGVDAITPVQVSAADMDTTKLKMEFGDRITFWGSIDTQHVLSRGTREEVREEVRHRISDLARGGGFVLAAVHNIQPEVPAENLVAMFEAAQEYGKYSSLAQKG